MARIRIKDFGPIKDGYTQGDGFIDITPVTVICGDQATGKSTIAKVYATFAWLEKDLIRSGEKQQITSDYFKKLCENQRIREYFTENTILEYSGNGYHFAFRKNSFSMKKNENAADIYKRPKIMYIPSERNLLTVIEDAESIRNLPVMLSLLLDEYNKSKKSSPTGEFLLPVSNLKLQYDKITGSTKIIAGDGSSVPISSSSSGVQSVASLSLVSRYLSKEVSSDIFTNIQKLSSDERTEIKNNIEKLDGNNRLSKELINEFDKFFLTGNKKVISSGNFAYLSVLLRYYFNISFINIVEEPEQNLYPASQSRVLYELLECMNTNEYNGLMITTHSPYMLSYLTLSAKAAELRVKKVPDTEINKIFPVKSAVSGSRITIYETKNDGTIQKLEPYESLPSDNNELNAALNETNETFAGLLELEEKFCR